MVINNIEKGKYIVIFLFLLFSPLLFNEIIIESTNIPRFLISNLFLLGALIFLSIKGLIHLPHNRLLLALVAFYFVHFISSIWSLNFADAIYESQKIWLGLSTIILFLSLLKMKAGNDKDLIQAIIITAFIFGAFNLIELTLSNNSTETTNYIVSLSIHKNLLSSLLFIFSSFTIFGVITYKDKWRWFSIITTTLILLLVLLLQTKAVLLAYLLSGFAFFIFYILRKQSTKIVKSVLIGTTGIAVISVFILFQLRVLSPVDDANSEELASIHERYILWNKSVKMIQSKPIIGVGASNWKYNYSKYTVNDLERSRNYNIVFKRAHNEYLTILSETGLIGFTLLILIILSLIHKKLSTEIASYDIKKILFVCTLIGIGLISFFSFPKERITHIVFVSIIIAIYSFNQLQSNTKTAQPFGLLLIAGLLLSIVVGSYRFYGEYYTKKVLQSQENLDAQNVIRHGLKASSIFYTVDPTMTPIDSYIGWAYINLDDMDSTTYYSQKAVELCPFDYKTQSNMGYALMRKYQLDQSKKALLESYRINNKYEPTLLNLSVLEYNKGNFMEALNWLKKIKNYQVHYPSNYERIMHKLSSP